MFQLKNLSKQLLEFLRKILNLLKRIFNKIKGIFKKLPLYQKIIVIIISIYLFINFNEHFDGSVDLNKKKEEAQKRIKNETTEKLTEGLQGLEKILETAKEGVDKDFTTYLVEITKKELESRKPVEPQMPEANTEEEAEEIKNVEAEIEEDEPDTMFTTVAGYVGVKTPQALKKLRKKAAKSDDFKLYLKTNPGLNLKQLFLIAKEDEFNKYPSTEPLQ